MKRHLSIFAFALLASFSAAGTVPKAVKARYTSLASAMRKVDFQTFATYFAADFTSVDPQGKTSTREQFFAQVKPMFEASSKATAVEKLLDSNSHDGVVDVSFDFTLKLTGKAGGVTTIHEVGTDTWKQVGTTWVMVKTVDTKFDITVPKPKKKKGKG